MYTEIITDVEDRRSLVEIIGNNNNCFTARDRVELLRQAYINKPELVKRLVSHINHEGLPAFVAMNTLNEIHRFGMSLLPYLNKVKDTFDEMDQMQVQLKEELNRIIHKYYLE